ncbi:MAG TPA: anhydro-N-acetylmuramic acid kinase [Acetobacteraceae bacterium]|nr:anhydro-N-acetylmuramic acid kinase [Acetobacteraceae bacterium]
MRTIGLMSGTSLDGVDAALVETDGTNISALGRSVSIAYDDALRTDLRGLLDRAPALGPSHPDVTSASQRLTEYHARAVLALGEMPDLIGFHGQTILHDPAKHRTWQIGDATLLARLTGVPVAHDFRSADVAAGGQGAPLAPVFHEALARGLPRPLAVLNIGGVANVTCIGDDGAMVAFDTGPGNGPLDDWVGRHRGERFDRDGALAQAGQINQQVLGRLMAHPYFAQPAPKSLDRLSFARALAASGLDALSPADGAATLVAFTVESAAAATLPVRPQRWLVCGGGRHNPALMAGLRARLGVPVEPVEAVGWDGDALEAQCFGFLAARVGAGLPISFPTTTGVPVPMTGGTITRPRTGQPWPTSRISYPN